MPQALPCPWKAGKGRDIADNAAYLYPTPDTGQLLRTARTSQTGARLAGVYPLNTKKAPATIRPKPTRWFQPRLSPR